MRQNVRRHLRRYLCCCCCIVTQLQSVPVTHTLYSPTMWSRMAPSRVLIVALASSSSTVSAFLPRPILATRPLSSSTCRFSSSSTTDTDTPAVLPTFDTKEDYLSFLQERSQLPKGFATGTAKGTFVSQEAPAMGKLPISGTVIHLTEGPTENWAAVFTKNKVRAIV